MTALGLLLALALASPSPSPCYSSLKFGGAIFIDAGQSVAAASLGSAAGETDPNPVPCGLRDRVTVFHVTGHAATEEVAVKTDTGYELYTSAGQAGFPAQGLLRWAVVAVVLVVIVFAAIPALTAHLRGARDDEGEPAEPSQT